MVVLATMAEYSTIVVRPGSDGALALGLCHLLDREGLAAERFLADEPFESFDSESKLAKCERTLCPQSA